MDAISGKCGKLEPSSNVPHEADFWSANSGTHVLVWMLNQTFENTAKQGANPEREIAPLLLVVEFHSAAPESAVMHPLVGR